jgi:hypothetical protein
LHGKQAAGDGTMHLLLALDALQKIEVRPVTLPAQSSD